MNDCKRDWRRVRRPAIGQVSPADVTRPALLVLIAESRGRRPEGADPADVARDVKRAARHTAPR